jgi:hypothetical protein
MKIEDVYSELHFLSDRLSSQVRTVALSIIALVWLFVAGGSQAPSLPEPPGKVTLLRIALLSLTCLLLDYLQYVFGYFATEHVRKAADSAGVRTAEYDYTEWRYRVRTALFWIKQVAVLIAVVWLGMEMLRALF